MIFLSRKGEILCSSALLLRLDSRRDAIDPHFPHGPYPVAKHVKFSVFQDRHNPVTPEEWPETGINLIDPESEKYLVAEGKSAL